MHRLTLLMTAALALALGACAGGVSYSQVEAQLPALAADRGRIYIYTPPRNFALNFQPEVLVAGASVGQSHSGTFLVVDRRAGEYRIEAAKQASFSAFSGQLSSVPANIFLAAGSKLYVRMQIEDEQLALRAESVAVPAEDGQRALRELSYRGGNALPTSD